MLWLHGLLCHLPERSYKALSISRLMKASVCGAVNALRYVR